MLVTRCLRHFSAAASGRATIQRLVGREVIDSRGNPTVEAEVSTNHGTFRAAVPSGASTGVHEAVELRDKDPARFGGKGVLKAVKHVSEDLNTKLHGMDVTAQKEIDDAMKALDGTPNKGRLGANAILAVSLAVAKAGAAARNVPLHHYIAHLAGKSTQNFILPVPFAKVLNGGVHASNRLAMQEFMMVPTGAKSFSEALRMMCETYAVMKTQLRKKFGLTATGVGDEGGFAPDISDPESAVQVLLDAISKAGFSGRVVLAMDVAASELYRPDDGKYDFNFKVQPNDGKQVLTGEELTSLYESLVRKYPIVSIEDPFEQDDWKNWKNIQSRLGQQVQIVGDDLLVTNPTRIARAKQEKAAGALLLKVNQIGTLSESIQACLDSQAAGWGVMVSHRSGETEDTTIADIAVGLGTGQIKTGAPARSERTAKYNQLLRIEEMLGSNAIYPGNNFRSPRV